MYIPIGIEIYIYKKFLRVFPGVVAIIFNQNIFFYRGINKSRNKLLKTKKKSSLLFLCPLSFTISYYYYNYSSYTTKKKINYLYLLFNYIIVIIIITYRNDLILTDELLSKKCKQKKKQYYK